MKLRAFFAKWRSHNLTSNSNQNAVGLCKARKQMWAIKCPVNRMQRLLLSFSILAMLVLSTMSASLLLPIGHAQTADSQNLVLGVVSPPPVTFATSSSDQFIGTTATEIPYLLLSPLALNGSAVPGIAEPPVLVQGTNGLKWEVNLISPNLKWSDGVQINSTDLAYSLGVYLRTGPYANMSLVDRKGTVSSSVRSIQILNSTAVEITTKVVKIALPVLVGVYPVYPWHFYRQFTGRNALATTAILSGPGDTAYVPVNYTAGSQMMTLIANPYSPSWNGRSPAIQQLTIQFFATESSLVNALSAGQIDAADIQPTDIPALQANSALQCVQAPSFYQVVLFTATKQYPWNVTTFRQALFYLVNKTQINSVLYNDTGQLGNPVLLTATAMNTFWPGPETLTYGYNTSKAIQLLGQAGLTYSQGHWTLPNGQPFTITIETSNNDPNLVRMAGFIASSEESIGLQVNQKIVDLSTTTNDLYSTQNFQELLFSESFAPTPFRYFANPSNWPQWKNSTFRSDVAQAESSTDLNAAVGLIKQAGLVLDQAAVSDSILLQPTYVAGNYKSFEGWQNSAPQALNYNVYAYPIFGENVLTSINPAQTISAQGSMSANDNYYYGILVIVAIVIIVGLGSYMRRHRTPTK
jgi:ABC-type transport system substrate-binding protein